MATIDYPQIISPIHAEMLRDEQRRRLEQEELRRIQRSASQIWIDEAALVPTHAWRYLTENSGDWVLSHDPARIPDPQEKPICEDLGDFLLNKYNKR